MFTNKNTWNTEQNNTQPKGFEFPIENLKFAKLRRGD